MQLSQMRNEMTTNPFQARREELGKTKTQLAREAGVSVAMVWQWEHDRCVPRTSRLESLLAAYEVNLRTMQDWIAEQTMRVLRERMRARAA